MRVMFFGSGAFGLPTLQRLDAEHEVAAVVSQPDRPAGRKRKLTPTPVADWAEARGLAVLKSEDVNAPAFVEQVAGFEPDASVVVAFGQKLSPELVGVMGGLAVNLHGSLLPKYRGAAPVNWAMIEGERVTGVTVIELAQRMDAGLMYGQAELEIDPRETAGELHDRLAGLGPDLVSEVLSRFEAGTLVGRAQDESQATRAPKLSKALGTVEFDQPADRVRARIHGLTPWPGCRVVWERGGGGAVGELTILRVEAFERAPAVVERAYPGGLPEPGTVLEPMLVVTGGGGVVRLLEVQAPGTRPMKAEAFGRGHGLCAGDRLRARRESEN